MGVNVQDVDKFIWQGRLRVMAIGDDCVILLEDSSTGEMFAKCPVAEDGTSIEAAIDSSRYFVIRIADPQTGKHAYVGLGFPERVYLFI